MAKTVRHLALPPLIVLIIATATIAAAWGFELIGGYIPCALCLKERLPYYVGIPLALAAFAAPLFGAPAWLGRLFMAATALVFTYGAYLGIYHAGAEWGWWLGPADCAAGAAPASQSAGDLLSQIENMRLVSCSEASWRFPAGWGLSFAGWNAAISLLLTGLAAWGAATWNAARTK